MKGRHDGGSRVSCRPRGRSSAAGSAMAPPPPPWVGAIASFMSPSPDVGGVVSGTPEEERHHDWIVGDVVAVLIGILLFWVVDTPDALPGAPSEGPDPLPGAPIEGPEQCEVSTNDGGYSC